MNDDNLYGGLDTEEIYDFPITEYTQNESLIETYFGILPLAIKEKLVSFLDNFDYSKPMNHFVNAFNSYLLIQVIGTYAMKEANSNFFGWKTDYVQDTEFWNACAKFVSEYIPYHVSNNTPISVLQFKFVVQSVMSHDGYNLANHLYSQG